MKHLVLLLLAFGLTANAALDVYDSTCALPKAPKHKWYFDAVNGSDVLGDGSALKPWKALTSVFSGTTTQAAAPGSPVIYVGAKYQPIPSFYADPNSSPGHRLWGNDPSAPIRPGDSLELATGNYGPLSYGVYTYDIHPSDFLTIEPSSATAKPVFTSVVLSGAGMFYMHDIKVQNATPGGTLVTVGSQGALPMVDYALAESPATDVIFDRMTFNSFDGDPSTWLATDWNTKPANAVYIYPQSASCVSVTNSAFSAVAGAAAIGGQKAVFSHNTINYFRDDGLDFYGNNLRIAYNRFTNSVATTAIHKDFFQGQIGRRIPGTFTNHYRNILIDNNVMLGKTEDKNQFYTYTQGINTFDEDWTNLVATNNVIIAASCHGIGFGSVHGGEIANNVVLHDLLAVTPGCTRGIIGVGGVTHESTALADHVHVHHNITQDMYVDLDSGNTWDHNMLVGNEAQYTPLQNGVTNWQYVPAPTDSNKLEKQMSAFIPALYRFDVSPVAGSVIASMKIGNSAGFYVPSPGVSPVAPAALLKKKVVK